MSMYKLKVCSIIGFDPKEDSYGLLVADALNGVNDPEDFIAYLRNKKDSIKYMNRIEKLDMLAYRYKKSARNLDRKMQGLIEQETKKLVGKFATAITPLRDNQEALELDLSVLKVEGKQWFTEKEISRLKAVGGLGKCIYLYEQYELYDSLYNLSVKRCILANHRPQLTNGENRVNKLIKNTIKEIK